MSWTKAGMLFVAIAAGTVMLAVTADEKGKGDDQKVEWKDVPAVVQATITTNANGGVVLEVEKETEKGKVVYSAEVKGKDGKTVEIEVADDGKLIKIEADDGDNKEEQEEADDDKDRK